tara:strand:+ start:982 stop:1197 length:216 start_codon:yes stop_codon:yes gene_type:complete
MQNPAWFIYHRAKNCIMGDHIKAESLLRFINYKLWKFMARPHQTLVNWLTELGWLVLILLLSMINYHAVKT